MSQYAELIALSASLPRPVAGSNAGVTTRTTEAAERDGIMNGQPIGQRLLAAGLINNDQLRIALIEQERTRQRLGVLLHLLGFASEATICDALARQLGFQRFDLTKHKITQEAIQLIPAETARRQRLLPISIDRDKASLQIAMAAPNDPLSLAGTLGNMLAGLDLEILFAGENEIEGAIAQHYEHTLAIDGILDEFEGKALANDTVGDSPAVRLIDALLVDAVHHQASDIHFEPETACLRIRYRIDGVLGTIRCLHKSTWPALSSRLKILAGMNIAETRAPQDGHFSQKVSARHIDFRAASQPGIHGENLVLRILDRQRGIVPLEALGLDDAQHKLFERMLARPEGLLLVTGPTGSGKTTTLYSVLNRLNHEGVHIMTLEDPVEYPFPLIRQTSLSDNVKLDFASGIRAMLRQDPDIMLIGEIRDAETAAMALRGALTGHQVHATLHAGSAISALARLGELGINSQMLHGNLIGIVAQRLIRRLCPHCQGSRASSPAEMHWLDQAQLPAAHGCSRCRQHGYSGRIALLEILRVDQPLDDLLAEGASAPKLLAQARKNGFRTMLDAGLSRVRAGETTLEEVGRVVDLTEYI
jgi:type II secretory ATPase GspE/PulE/Tfp pilus assembly ATPase PilB-like protein